MYYIGIDVSKKDLSVFNGKKEELKGELIGLIVPHAGYDYSGEIAAYAYKQLEGKNFNTVILIGESHYHRFPGASIGNYQSYQTPLGEVKADLTPFLGKCKHSEFS